MTIDMSAPGSTNLLQEEDGHRRGSLWSLIAILGKKLLLPGLLYKVDTENPQREDC